MRHRRALAIAGIALIALAGCGGGSDKQPADPSKLDDAANFACTDFAKGYKSAQTKQARIDLANKVNEWAATSKTERIADLGAALGRGADGSPEAWQLAADAFAARCMEAGWTGESAA